MPGSQPQLGLDPIKNCDFCQDRGHIDLSGGGGGRSGIRACLILMAPGRQAAGGCRQGGTTTHYLAPSARPRQWGLQPLLRRPRHETAVGTTTPAKLFVPGSCLILTCTVRARLRFAGPPAATTLPEGPFKGCGNSPPDGTGSLQSLDLLKGSSI